MGEGLRMIGIDLKEKLNDYILDEKRKIPKAHLDSVCKIHHGAETCRYIFLGMKGFMCLKNSPIQEDIDRRVTLSINGALPEAERMSARGDNCEGLGDEDQDIQDIQES